MVWIILSLFMLENALLAVKYRAKIIKLFRYLSSRIDNDRNEIIHIEDEDNAWYSTAPTLILHGGGYNGHRYNNSKEGIDAGIKKYSVIEIDVGITSDNVLVLTHRFEPDDEIIFDSKPTLDEFMKNGALEGETPLSLKQFVNFYNENDSVYFLVDCAHGIEMKVASELVKICDEKFLDRLIFQVHGIELLKKISNMKRFKNIHYNGTLNEISQMLHVLRENNIHTCSVMDREIAPENPALICVKESGIHIFSYVVNHNRRLQRDLKLGVDGVFTDVLSPKCIGII